MELTGNGLNKGSHMYFYHASQNAKKLLYYPIAAGEFYCNGAYCVERDHYDSILAMYIAEGSMTLLQDNTRFGCILTGITPMRGFVRSLSKKGKK